MSEFIQKIFQHPDTVKFVGGLVRRSRTLDEPSRREIFEAISDPDRFERQPELRLQLDRILQPHIQKIAEIQCGKGRESSVEEVYTVFSLADPAFIPSVFQQLQRASAMGAGARLAMLIDASHDRFILATHGRISHFRIWEWYTLQQRERPPLIVRSILYPAKSGEVVNFYAVRERDRYGTFDQRITDRDWRAAAIKVYRSPAFEQHGLFFHFGSEGFESDLSAEARDSALPFVFSGQMLLARHVTENMIEEGAVIGRPSGLDARLAAGLSRMAAGYGKGTSLSLRPAFGEPVVIAISSIITLMDLDLHPGDPVTLMAEGRRSRELLREAKALLEGRSRGGAKSCNPQVVAETRSCSMSVLAGISGFFSGAMPGEQGAPVVAANLASPLLGGAFRCCAMPLVPRIPLARIR